jgi:AcrR family transcriptional regulator
MQPSVYHRDDIIEAAFSLLRERGWQALSVRKVAERLGASTMPIYSHVRSSQELERELRKKGRQLLVSYQRGSYTEDPLLDMAFGYILFARDEKYLFRFLFLDSSADELPVDFSGMRDHFAQEFSEALPENGEGDGPLKELSSAAQDELMRNSWIFTHGLATLINAGALGDCSDADVLEYLRSSGEAFYLRARMNDKDRRKEE